MIKAEDIIKKLDSLYDFKTGCINLIKETKIAETMGLGELSPDGVSDFLIESLRSLKKASDIFGKEADRYFNNLSNTDLEKDI